MRATIERAGAESARESRTGPGPDAAVAGPVQGAAAFLAEEYWRCEVRPGKVPVIDHY